MPNRNLRIATWDVMLLCTLQTCVRVLALLRKLVTELLESNEVGRLHVIAPDISIAVINKRMKEVLMSIRGWEVPILVWSMT